MGEPAVEERLSSLEAVLESFIISTHVMIREIKKENAAMKQDTEIVKREMQEDTAKMKQDTEIMKREMKQDTEIMKREMNKKWGELANKMGTIVEDIVAPNIAGIAKKYFNVDDFEFFAIRVKCKNSVDATSSREFDVIAVSKEFFFINETKSTAKISYVSEFIDVLKVIYNYFPNYKEKKVVPIFSSLSIPDDVQKYLTKHHIYAMTMKDDTMDLVNFNEIQ